MLLGSYIQMARPIYARLNDHQSVFIEAGAVIRVAAVYPDSFGLALGPKGPILHLLKENFKRTEHFWGWHGTEDQPDPIEATGGYHIS